MSTTAATARSSTPCDKCVRITKCNETFNNLYLDINLDSSCTAHNYLQVIFNILFICMQVAHMQQVSSTEYWQFIIF